jgi:hypothetical protein
MKGSLVSLSISIISGVLQMFSSVLWVGVGLGLIGFIVFFPRRQIINPKRYLNMSVSNIDYSHIKGTELATEPYIRPIINFENRADFRMYFTGIQGTAELGELQPINLQHELISIRPLTVKPHNSRDGIFHIAITQDIAKRIVNYADCPAEIVWKFRLGVHMSIGLAIFRRSIYFEIVLDPYKHQPTILDLDLLEKLGEYKGAGDRK